MLEVYIVLSTWELYYYDSYKVLKLTDVFTRKFCSSDLFTRRFCSLYLEIFSESVTVQMCILASVLYLLKDLKPFKPVIQLKSIKLLCNSKNIILEKFTKWTVGTF